MRLTRLTCSIRLAAIAASAALVTSCAPVVKVRKKNPVCLHTEPAAACACLESAHAHRRSPEVALGHTLEAAEIAAEALRRNPRDDHARGIYNHAVARSVEHLQEAGLQPCSIPSSRGTYQITFKTRSGSDRRVADYEFTAADTITCGGTSFRERVTVDGLGAPLVVSSRAERKDFRKDFSSARLYGTATAVLHFRGRQVELEFAEPLAQEHITMNGHRYPLAADFTAALAVGMSRERPDKLGLIRMLNPERFAETARLTRLQVYDPKRIPIVFVHGLNSSPATWVTMINELRADPEIRRKYQLWVYSYPSGYPYPYSASLLRQELNAVRQKFPDHKPIVLVGHSMGGCISRLMITDAGERLWRVYFGESPSETHFAGAHRKKMEQALIFSRQPRIARVVFVCAPLRGAATASNWIGRFGSRLVRTPHFLADMRDSLVSVITVDPAALRLSGMPNSIDTLAPNNRFVKEINKLPLAPGVPYHTIIGDRGRGDSPNSSDGLVAYWSSHMDGAVSQCIVPSNHIATERSETIAEMKRILRLHAGLRGKSQ